MVLQIVVSATVIMEHSADWGCMPARARERAVVHAGADNAASKMDLVNLPLPPLCVLYNEQTALGLDRVIGPLFHCVISSS